MKKPSNPPILTSNGGSSSVRSARCKAGDFLSVRQRATRAWSKSAMITVGYGAEFAAQKYALQSLHDLPEQHG